MAGAPRPQPFTVSIPDSDLDDLRRRLLSTRWPEDPGNADWTYGVERGWLQEMTGYWADDFDWRAQERTINELPQLMVELEGVPVHFVHVAGGGSDRTPLILTHGWPWTFWDWKDVIRPLVADGFDVVVPSLPGFGFSAPLVEQRARRQDTIHSHRAVHTFEPQTLSYALMDSPVGTAAWLWSRRRDWSDCAGDVLAAFDRDFLCTTASIYRLTGTVATSLRLYREQFRRGASPQRVISVPTGFGIFPGDALFMPRRTAERLTNLVRWSPQPRGGHFAPAEVPELVVEELRAFAELLARRRASSMSPAASSSAAKTTSRPSSPLTADTPPPAPASGSAAPPCRSRR